MFSDVEQFFGTTSFLAHGYCLTWRSDLIALHAISDATIFASYFIIPIAIFYFVSKRQDLAHKGIFALFAAFIFACGTTHLIGLITLWDPIYGLEGLVKAGTAAVSAATVVAAWMAIPKALLLPSPAMLRESNLKLVQAVESQTRANHELTEIRADLERRVAERTSEIQTKAAEIETANESLRQFAHIASHDLQEPLRKIASYTDILEQALADDDEEEARRAMERLRAMSSRARGMVADLLRFSRMSQYEHARDTIELASVEAEMRELFEQPVTERGGVLVFDLGDYAIEGDRLLVRQIFQNILSNSVKYTPNARLPEITVRAEMDEDRLRIRFADNGIGFDPTLSSRIFEPFTRLHGRRIADGSGIGLAIVARAIQRLEWAISVETVEGQGTTFTVEIPGRDIRNA